MNLSFRFKCRLLQLDESILDATETLIKMRALFDNYEMDAAVNEHVSPIERKEENEFINAVLATSVMRTAMKFLQDKGNFRCANEYSVYNNEFFHQQVSLLPIQKPILIY